MDELRQALLYKRKLVLFFLLCSSQLNFLRSGENREDETFLDINIPIKFWTNIKESSKINLSLIIHRLTLNDLFSTAAYSTVQSSRQAVAYSLMQKCLVGPI